MSSKKEGDRVSTVAMAESQTDLAAAALVREYLSRKGYKQALAELDAARPRSERDMSSRTELMKELKLERLVKRNRERPRPLPTMLELIAEHLLLSERGLKPATEKKVEPETVLSLPSGGPLTPPGAPSSRPSRRAAEEKGADLGYRVTCSELPTRRSRGDG